MKMNFGLVVTLGLMLGAMNARGDGAPPKSGQAGSPALDTSPGPHTANQYIACKVNKTVPAVFPLRLLHDGILRGEALLAIEIDAEGKLRDVLIVAYTQREFADAAVDAVRQWKYTAGMIDLQPVGSRINITFQFEVNGVVAYEKRMSSLPFGLLANEGYEYRPRSATELDRPLKALERPRPIYPRQWMTDGRKGNVVVEFYVDETGRPRMAVPLGRGDDLLTAAALAAIREWRFTAPQYQGAPALVRAEQLFVFEPAVETGG